MSVFPTPTDAAATAPAPAPVPPPVPPPAAEPLWPGPCLFVPIHVECLLIGTPNRTGSWADLAIDYRKVPQNVDPEPQPFQLRTAGNAPATGAHLQITLPYGLRNGRQEADGTVAFPALPNRWLIVRSVVAAPGAPPVLTAWILQGDFLGAFGEGANSYPDPDRPGNTRWIGKAWPLAGWTNPDGPATPVLRSMGPGSVGWIATADNTRNMLCFHDGLGDVASGTVSYAVLGWYRPAGFDPLLGVSADEPRGFTSEESWERIMAALRFDVHGRPGLAEAEAAWRDWREANPMTGGPAIEPAQARLASQSLCHGMVFGLAWSGPGTGYARAPILDGRNPVSVAVGSTAVEAIAAWMAAVLRQPDLEDLILAIQQDHLFDYLQDPATFAVGLLEARFAKSAGGSAWLVAPPENSEAERGRTLQTVDLSVEQTRALTALNAGQSALDQTDRLIAGNAGELFALAYKLTQALPHGEEHRATETALAATKAALQALTAQRATQEAAVEAGRTALETLLGSSFVLSRNDQAHFHGAGTPTVMVAGIQTDTRFEAPGADGGPDETLFCRFTGQTVSALTVIEPVGGTAQTITAADIASRIALPAAGTGVPKETTDCLVEAMLFDTANARLFAAIAFEKAGVTPTPAQLGALAATVAAQQTAPWSATPQTAYTEETVGAAVGFLGMVPLKRSAMPWSPPWTPLFIDWEATWHPTGSTAATMLDGWALDGFDYDWTGARIAPAAGTLRGRSVLGTRIAAGLAEKLNDLITADPDTAELPRYQQALLKAAAADIAGYDIVTKAMSGLGVHMLMRKEQMTRLTSPDPEIQGWIDRAPATVCLPGGGGADGGGADGFHPLRAGHLVIDRLWVVDAFGQILRTTKEGDGVLPIRARSVVTPDRGGADNRRLIQLAPRIQQPARLELRLLDAEDDSTPSNASDRTSPICGWLLPNHLDDSVQLFDANGTALGDILSVETDGGRGLRWDPAPGLTLPLGAPPRIGNAHLLAFVQGLLAQEAASGDEALRELLDVIDVTLWTTAPSAQPAGNNLAVLIGQPVAVVRADIALALSGDPAWNQSWADTGKRNDGGLTAVPFATHVGDIALPGNGVLGYYLDDDYGRLSPLRGFDRAFGTVRRAMAAATGDARANLDRAMAGLPALLAPGAPVAGSGYLDPAPSVPLLPNGPRHRLTVLMDPRNALTAVTGITPVVTVPLPPGPVSTMDQLRATFRLGPVLLDPQRVRMPLPAAVSGNWSWIARTGVTLWETVTDVKGNQPEALLPTNPPQIREGWLGLVPTAPDDTAAPMEPAGRPPVPAGGPVPPLARMNFLERPAAMPQAPRPQAIETQAIGPAAGTLYTYAFTPGTLIAGATAAPILYVTNPGSEDAPDPAAAAPQTIYVEIPIGPSDNGIATSLAGVTVEPTDPEWLVLCYFGTSQPYMKLTGPALKARDSVGFAFQNLTVGRQAGVAVFTVTEQPSGGTATPTIVKTATPLAIETFGADPLVVTQGQATTLSWTVTGGSYVLVNPHMIRRPVTESGSDQVTVPVDGPMTTYLLRLYADDRQYVDTSTIVYVGPVSATLDAAPSGPIDTDSPVTLSWSSAHAVPPLRLASPTGFADVGPSGAKTVIPGKELTASGDTVTYTLQADGHKGPKVQTATLAFNPARIRWFRYTDDTRTSVSWRVANAAPGWPIVTMTGETCTLTLCGPGTGGKPLTAHLGSGPDLQVTVLSATPKRPAPGERVTVTYRTQNAKAATLAIGLGQPGATAPLDADRQTGTVTITAPGTPTILVLTISAPGQAPVSSELDLDVAPIHP